MNRKVVIFNELPTQFPLLGAFLGQAEVELLSVTNGRDALKVSLDELPALSILDVAMPQLSGIECCRQLKESMGGTGPKVVLLSTIESSALEQRSMDAGCDFFGFTSKAGPALIDFLENVLAGKGAKQETASWAQPPAAEPPPPPLPEDRPPRVEVFWAVTYNAGDADIEGEVINASRSGLLISAPGEISKDARVKVMFRASSGASFEVNGTVVRTAPLKEPRGDHNFAVGLRVDDLTPEMVERFAQVLGARLKITPDFTRSVLEGGPELVEEALREPNSNQQLLFLLGELRPFEREAFTSTEPMGECVRRMIALRAHCRVFHQFLPTLNKDRNTLASVFLPLFEALLKRADDIEQETEEFVRQAVAAGNESARNGLNEVSNRLHDVKMKLLATLADRVSPEGLGPEGQVILAVRERVAHFRSLAKQAKVDLKYERRAPPSPLKTDEGKSAKGRSILRSPFVILSAIAVSLILMVGAALSFLGSRVAASELLLPLEISKAVQSEDGLVVHTALQAWDRLAADQRLETFKKLEQYLRKEHLPQMKIVDENGRPLAALLGGRVGRTMAFSSRIFR